jgi:hypothetical protein
MLQGKPRKESILYQCIVPWAIIVLLARRPLTGCGIFNEGSIGHESAYTLTGGPMHKYIFSFTSSSNPDIAGNAVFPANMVPYIPKIGDRILCSDFKNGTIDGVVTERTFRFESERIDEGNGVSETVVLFILETEK